MGFGSFFHKISHGAGNLFKKVEHGAGNFLKKSVAVVNKIPSIANTVGNQVKKIGNAIQSKSDIIAPILAGGALALGQPEISAGILAGQQAIQQTNNMLQQRTGQAQQAISTAQKNFNGQVGNLSNMQSNSVLLPQ